MQYKFFFSVERKPQDCLLLYLIIYMLVIHSQHYARCTCCCCILLVPPTESFYRFYSHTLINPLYPLIHHGFSYEGSLFLLPEGKSYPHGCLRHKLPYSGDDCLIAKTYRLIIPYSIRQHLQLYMSMLIVPSVNSYCFSGAHWCEQSCLRLWTFLFTTDSLFVHGSEPLTTLKQKHIRCNRIQIGYRWYTGKV